MTSDIILIILIGLPGSGKTTFAKLLHDHLKFSYNTCTLHFDDYFYHYSVEKYREVRKKLLRSIEYSLLKIKSDVDFSNENLLYDLKFESVNSSNLHAVILDDNFYYRSMRYEYYKLLKSMNLSFCQIYLNCEIQIALKQNLLRPEKERVSENIIYNMNMKLERPDFSKYTWERFSLILNVPFNIHEIYENITQMIKNSLQNPIKSDENEMVEMSQSLLHRIDICLRRKVNVEIKNIIKSDHIKSDQAEIIKSINNKKQDLFVAIKNKQIFLDENLELENVIGLLFDNYVTKK